MQQQKQSSELFLWCENILHLSTHWNRTVECEILDSNTEEEDVEPARGD